MPTDMNALGGFSGCGGCQGGCAGCGACDGGGLSQPMLGEQAIGASMPLAEPGLEAALQAT